MGVVVQHLGSYIRDRRAVVEVVPKSQSDRIREFSTTFSVSSGDLFEILEHLATLSRKQHGTCMDLQCFFSVRPPFPNVGNLFQDVANLSTCSEKTDIFCNWTGNRFDNHKLSVFV